MDRRSAYLAAALLLGAGLAGCERPTAAGTKKAAAPAKVEKLPGEADLTTIHLTEDGRVPRWRARRAFVARVPERRAGMRIADRGEPDARHS